MQIVPPHYPASSGRYAIIRAVAPSLQSWFADTLTEPIPEKLVAIIRRMDKKPTTDNLSSRQNVQHASAKAPVA